MLLPPDRPAGMSFFKEGDVVSICLPECVVKGASEADIIPAPALAEGGIPSGTLSSSHVNCLFACGVAPGSVFLAGRISI